MNNSNNSVQCKAAARANRPQAGFTLIEMIVSVALVLLMMLMFTEIFQILSGSMTTQRGISENDQRERLLVTVLQSDLDHRTFQYLQPFARSTVFTTPSGVTPLASDPRSPEFHHHDRQGYFYISENDPNDDTDDLLQFTVSRYADPSQEDQTEGYFYGHALDMSDRLEAPHDTLATQPNQPEADDAQYLPDGTSRSSAAEISYFLRGSNLYRRIMLIREPLKLVGSTETQPRTYYSPSSGSISESEPIPFFERPTSPPPNSRSLSIPLYGEASSFINGGVQDNFWRDFDFSAFMDTVGTPYARFHDLGDLQNYLSPSFSLGHPRFRFGFNHATGLSREYIPTDASTSPQIFMGRFTHEETSHAHFNYPHDLMHSSIGGGGNPMDPTGPTLIMNHETRVIDDLREGTRRSEDLVLSNVRSFDIKVFDDLAGAFVDLGSSEAVRFAVGERENTVHGNSQRQNVFDTWHPSTSTGSGDPDPPFPMLTDPTTGNPDYDMANRDPVPTSAPLSAIRILIRYEDPTSGQIRQMTLIHPLRNKGEG